jgi:hypothetical protein
MRYIIESISEMNFNYLYLDEKCLSYHNLLDNLVISNMADVSNSEKDPSHSNRERSLTHSMIKRKDNSNSTDNYYNVIIFNYIYL